jgi:hypothetical protein
MFIAAFVCGGQEGVGINMLMNTVEYNAEVRSKAVK